MSAPTPQPPGAWRALAREALLNPEERAAKARALAELAEPARPPEETPELPSSAPPELRLSPYQSLIDRAGWKLRAAVTEKRARIEAFHPSGAAVMVTAALGRHVNVYVLPAAEKNIPSWRVIHRTDLEIFLSTRSIRSPYTPTCLCNCDKRRYPTEDYAKTAKFEVNLRRVVKEHGAMGERRAYRCEDDDRVWHLTSRASWRKRPPNWKKRTAK